MLAPPNRLPPGLLAVFPLFPKSPPLAGVVEVVAPPPNGPPLVAAVAGVVEEAPPPPKRPADEGVAEPPPPPKSPAPVDAGVVEAVLVAVPPKRPPAGFCAEAPVCWPNKPPGLPAGVVLLPAVAPPKENLGVPAAAPKREPEAGAVDVVLLFGALEEPPVPPKLNDMVTAGGLRISFLASGELSIAVSLVRSRDIRRLGNEVPDDRQ